MIKVRQPRVDLFPAARLALSVAGSACLQIIVIIIIIIMIMILMIIDGHQYYERDDLGDKVHVFADDLGGADDHDDIYRFTCKRACGLPKGRRTRQGWATPQPCRPCRLHKLPLSCLLLKSAQSKSQMSVLCATIEG